MTPPNVEYVAVRRRTPVLGIVLLLALICLIAIGFARGWFAISSNQDQVTEKTNVKLTVDREKMRQDVRRATDKAKEEGSAISDKVKQESKEIEHKVKPRGD
jgi:hypothetical protein